MLKSHRHKKHYKLTGEKFDALLPEGFISDVRVATKSFPFFRFIEGIVIGTTLYELEDIACQTSK